MSTSRKREAPSPPGAAIARAASQESSQISCNKPAAGSNEKQKACPTAVALPTKRRVGPAVAPPTKSNRSSSPSVSLARHRLQIGGKDQIPKMNGIGPSTVTVSARKQRWIFQIPLLYPDSTKMFYGTAGVTVHQYLNNCREETDWFLSYVFWNCGIILYASNP
jgi:hypothetical protein